MNTSFAIACIAATALAGPMNSHMNAGGLGKLGMDPDFNEYAARNNKNYFTTSQFQERQGNYHQADNIIGSNNRNANAADPDALILKHNQFSDWTNEEYRSLLNLPQTTVDRAVSLPQHSQNGYNSNNTRGGLGGGRGGGRGGRGLEDVATTVDHAADGFMVSVKNQGGCGSCWAFAANTAAEGTLAKKTGASPVHLSEQQMVDCTLAVERGGTAYNGKDYGAWGCQGAWMENAWDFMKDNGAMYESDYSYTSGLSETEGTCMHDNTKTHGNIDTWGQIQDSVDDMKARVRMQPVAVALDAGQAAFQYYSSGVVQLASGCGETLNHAVVIVGYTDGNSPDPTPPGPDPEPTPNPPASDCTVTKWWHSCPQQESRRLQDSAGHTDYWKVQNSWSTGWGDNGFIKIGIADGAGVCGINSVVQWVEWADKY